MLQRARIRFGVVAAAVILVGCTTAPEPQPNGQVVVPVSAERRPQATVKLLNEVIVRLPPITTPGNVWTLVLNDERFFQQRRAIQQTPDGGALATFLAIHVGRRAIRFFALPPNAREGTPTQAYDILITVE